MDRIREIADDLCDAERERLAMVEIGIDEALTILERHGMTGRDNMMRSLAGLSGDLHMAMTAADGPEKRLVRMKRVRSKLTKAFPLTDADLGQ